MFSFKSRAATGACILAGGVATYYTVTQLLPNRNPSAGRVVPLSEAQTSKSIYSRLPENLEQNDSALAKKWALSTSALQDLLEPDRKNHPNVLHQMATCPFCSKVRAFLRAYDIPFETVEVDPVGMKGVKHKTYKKVPQFQVGGKTNDGQLLLDSSEIVSILAAPFGDEVPRPDDTAHWRSWANNVLARYIAIEIGTNFRASSKFIANHPDLSAGKKLKYLAAGVVMFFAAHKVVAPKLNKLGYDTTNTKLAMHSELQKWGDRLDTESHCTLHGGDKPSLADTDVFGVLSSVRGHAIYSDILEYAKANSESLEKWIGEMEKRVCV